MRQLKLIIFCIIFLSGTANGAMYEVINEEEKTDQAISILTQKGKMLYFCDWCPGYWPEVESVKNVDKRMVQNGFSIFVNDFFIDLAKAYILEPSGWVNLAYKIGLDTNNAAQVLPKGFEDEFILPENYVPASIEECRNITSGVSDTARQIEMTESTVNRYHCIKMKFTKLLAFTDRSSLEETEAKISEWTSMNLTFVRHFIENSQKCRNSCGSLNAADHYELLTELIEKTMFDVAYYN